MSSPAISVDLAFGDTTGLPSCPGSPREGAREAHAKAEIRRAANSPSAFSTVQELFEALCAKDGATAAHSLRTTLGCAVWSDRLRLSPEERESLETAALLHDIGKIVAPPNLLVKAGPLTDEEREMMELCRRMGLEVVRDRLALPSVLDVVTHAGAWYDGSRGFKGLAYRDLPFGARMLAIIDAYDAMTTQQAYRPAMPYERALAELRQNAGTQFDPQLVEHFCSLPAEELRHWQATAHERALPLLRQAITIAEPQTVEPVAADMATSAPIDLFYLTLLENMRDAIVFVDRDIKIIYWGRGAARLTGITPETAVSQRWTPSLIGMRDGRGTKLGDDDCPAAYAVRAGKQWLRRILLTGADGGQEAVDVQVTPVVAADARVVGATILMRDLSPELSLRERFVSLQHQTTRDALTQVANRAEFDRAHAHAITSHLEQRLPYAIILCDIDHFKQINDTYGHQAGDEVLKEFATLLQGSCRGDDLVTRYGGEEFAILCPGCNVTAATQRAEAIRHLLAKTPHPVLGGRNITASFGVTGLRSGDTPAKMLGRSDKALYEAKASGRNCVIAIGGSDPDATTDGGQPGSPGPDSQNTTLVEQVLVTMVPQPLAVEKLLGFVHDHKAEVVTAGETHLRLKVDVTTFKLSRRLTDRRLECYLDVEFESPHVPDRSHPHDCVKAGGRTRIHVKISTVRDRDRRRRNAVDLGRQVLSSLRSYLMVNIDDTLHGQRDTSVK